MKKPKLYVETGTKHAITMVCANKISCLEPYLPDLKKIQNHLIYERGIEWCKIINRLPITGRAA